MINNIIIFYLGSNHNRLIDSRLTLLVYKYKNGCLHLQNRKTYNSKWSYIKCEHGYSHTYSYEFILSPSHHSP